jgi:hypothetical protein
VRGRVAGRRRGHRAPRAGAAPGGTGADHGPGAVRGELCVRAAGGVGPWFGGAAGAAAARDRGRHGGRDRRPARGCRTGGRIRGVERCGPRGAVAPRRHACPGRRRGARPVARTDRRRAVRPRRADGALVGGTADAGRDTGRAGRARLGGGPLGERLGGSDVGVAGQGAYDDVLATARTAFAGLQAGVCAGSVARAVDYTNTREQFGRPLATKQGVQLRAADAYMDTEAIRVTAYEAAWRRDEGLDYADARADRGLVGVGGGAPRGARGTASARRYGGRPRPSRAPALSVGAAAGRVSGVRERSAPGVGGVDRGGEGDA